MKIYKVTAPSYDYDEYDAFIVRAENEEQARGLAIEMAYGGSSEYRQNKRLADHQGWQNADVEEVLVEGEAEVILGSFNAG
jgi:hypothetical protein